MSSKQVVQWVNESCSNKLLHLAVFLSSVVPAAKPALLARGRMSLCSSSWTDSIKHVHLFFYVNKTHFAHIQSSLQTRKTQEAKMDSSCHRSELLEEELRRNQRSG